MRKIGTFISVLVPLKKRHTLTWWNIGRIDPLKQFIGYLVFIINVDNRTKITSKWTLARN